MHPKIITSDEAVMLTGVNILVMGESGVGKTYLAKSLHDQPDYRVMLISAEAGTLSIAKDKIPTWVIKSEEDLDEVYEYLANRKEAADNFDVIGIDSLSEIAEAVLADRKAQNNDPRKAYGEMADFVIPQVKRFRDLPFHVYMTCKLALEKDDKNRARFVPLVPGQQIGHQLPYLFDEVFTLRAETDENDKNRTIRAFQTGKDERYQGKDRSGALETYEDADLTYILNKIGAHIMGDEPAAQAAE